MVQGWVLVVGVVLAAWWPIETHPLTAIALTGAGLGLTPWAWDRTSPEGLRRVLTPTALWFGFVLLGQIGGWDRAAGISQCWLIAGVLALLWFGSREAPESGMIQAVAIGMAALALWGLWQSFGGLEQLRGAAEGLPEHLRPGALARINRARAFASFMLPSHLAVVLGTALPLLVSQIGRHRSGLVAGGFSLLATAGILATRSPVGIGLAAAACLLAVVSRRQRGVMSALLIAGVAAVGGVIAVRPDVLQLEPILLRVDNWGTALWVWSTAPISGVGLGGFGQAAQAVPWPVGNHPAHAHGWPLEVLADLGIAGLVLWVLLAAWFIALVRRTWRDRPALAASLLVVPAHNLVDFSIYTSAVAIPWALLTGWALALDRESQTVTPDPRMQRIRWVPVGLASAGLGLALLSGTAVFIQASSLGAPNPQERFQLAERSARLAPWRPSPVRIAGEVALAAGDPELIRSALALMERARWQQPRSASSAQLEGRLQALGARPVQSILNLWRAQKRQPYDHRRRSDFVAGAEALKAARDARP